MIPTTAVIIDVLLELFGDVNAVLNAEDNPGENFFTSLSS